MNAQLRLPEQLEVSFGTPLRVIVEQAAQEGEWRGIFTLWGPGYEIKGEAMSSTLQSGVTQKAKVSWVDAAGNAATVDGETQWASSDAMLATVTADGTDSTLAVVVSVGPIGAVQVQATADADMGAGVQTITAVLDVTIIAGQASAGTIAFVP